VIPTFCVYLGLFRVQLTAATGRLQVSIVAHHVHTGVSLQERWLVMSEHTCQKKHSVCSSSTIYAVFMSYSASTTLYAR
jgi:hypothetical protein